MKSKIFTVVVLSFIAFVALLPSFSLAAHNRYSFTMSYRVVDGSENGQYHTLSKGSADLLGMHKISSSLPGAGKAYNVHYTLYNKTSGNSFGDIVATPYTSYNSFWGTYKGLGGGTKYYLLIWKTDVDGHTITGSGEISN